MRKPILLFLLLATFVVFGQKRTYQTNRFKGEAPKIDGYLTEEAWESVDWAGDFTQWMPSNGASPSQATEFKIIYDDNYLYVAIKALDSVPEEIVKRMSRRDGFQGDFVEINIDSYHDYLTAYSFSATAAGVKGDEKITKDGENWNDTWDPIWYLNTSSNEKGWIAEFKIPLTQLRFSSDSVQVWGLEVKRRLYRKDERSVWQAIPNEQSGYVSRFGELHGLTNLQPKRQIDVTPYAVGSYEHYKEEEGSPFYDGDDWKARAGVDAKIGLTNNLTMDLTINPDFGQVEADPSEVNLSAFESYFDEKRPFFIEGRNIYNYPIEEDGSYNGLFYSRRIGRSPHYYPENDYVKMPNNTTILGAAKVTGKTSKGLSIGILESITNTETAEVMEEGGRIKKINVEPMTNYFAGRLEQELNKGNTIIGGMLTSTNRFIKDEHLEDLPNSAQTGGLNFKHSWKDKKYYFSARFLGSRVSGDSAAMMNMQTSSRRYYQRPDAKKNRLDSTAKSLSGHAGNLSFGTNINSGWNYNTWFNWLSPGLDFNDMGYLRSTDNINQGFWVGYSSPQPRGVFRKVRINMALWNSWNFDGVHKNYGANANTWLSFTNYWSYSLGGSFSGPSNSPTLLRGGPIFITPRGLNYWTSIETDTRKKLSFDFSFSQYKGAFNYRTNSGFNIDITYRPTDRLKISLEPSYEINQNRLQYLSTEEYKGKDQYFLAEINQRTLMIEFRVDYSFTPDLSLQYYGQPFVSNGTYSNYKWVTDSKASNYEDRFVIVERDAEGNIDLDGNQEADVYIEDNDFKFVYFQSNLVLRWEYMPGSTVYLVWSQSRDDSDFERDQLPFEFDEDMNHMFRVFPHDVFLVKLSYRIPI